MPTHDQVMTQSAAVHRAYDKAVAQATAQGHDLQGDVDLWVEDSFMEYSRRYTLVLCANAGCQAGLLFYEEHGVVAVPPGPCPVVSAWESTP